MDFKVNNRPKLPRNRFGWVDQGGSGNGNGSGGSGLDSNTLNSIYDLIDWFYKVGDVVHSRYSFAGDYEVAAFREGSSGMVETYNTSWIDSSFAWLIGYIGDSSASGDGPHIPDSSIRAWNDAADKAHTHDNKDVLDSISEQDLANWRNTALDVSTWFYWDNETSTLHTPHSFVGDQEVAAWQNGSSGNIDTYNTSWIDSSYAYLLDQIENVSGGSGGGGADIPNASVLAWNEAYNKAHIHNNKAILDGISDSSISTWNSAYIDLNDWFYKDSSGYVHSKYTFVGDEEVAAHRYGEGTQVNTYNTSWIDSSFAWLVDQIENVSGGSGGGTDIPDISVSNWNEAYNKAHTHTNKSVLDSISNTDLTTWRNTCTNFNDWFYKDSSGFVHSRYTFVGDYEVAAYGYGMDGIVESYSKQHIDTSYNDLLDLIRDISGGGGDISLIDYAKKQWVEDNFLRNVSFNEYKAITNISINYINTSINDISTRLANTNASVVDLKDWFYKDSSGYVHSKYTLVGDHEVAAHGYGQGGIVESYSKQHIDSSYNYILDVIDDISVDIDLSEYVKNSSLSTNYPNNASVNNNYVKNASYNTLNTKVNNISTRLNDVSTRLNNVSVNLNDISTKFHDWFYKDSSGYVHSKYTFVGDNEVAAHGYGQGGIVESYSKQHIDTSYNEILDLIDNIDVDVDLSEYVKNSSLSTNYPNNASVNNNYVKKSAFNSSYNALNTKVNDVSTRLNNVSTRLNNVSTRLNNVSTRLSTTNASVNTLEDWFYKDSSGYVHSKYTFVGDNEVAAHGYGQGGIVESYSKQHIDSSYNEILDLIDNIDVDVDLSGYVKNSSLSANYPKNSSVANNYVKNSSLVNNYPNNSSVNNNYVKNASFNTLNTKVDNVSTRLNNVSTRLNNVSTRLAPLTEWFYKDSSGRVHSRYSFVGDEEVAAFGAGESGGEIDLTNYVKIHADNEQTIYSPIYVYDALSADDFISYGDIRSDGDVTAAQDVSVYRDLKVGRNASINGTLKVGGISNFNSSIITKTNASIGQKLFVKGTTTLTGNSSINASLFVKNDVSLGGKLYTNEIRTPIDASVFVINSKTQISNDTTLSGKLTISNGVNRIQIGPTTIPTSYDVSIIFGNSRNGFIRSYKNNSNKHTYLVVSSSDYLTFSGNQISIDCPVNIDGDIDTTGNLNVTEDIHYGGDLINDSDRRLKTDILDLSVRGPLYPKSYIKDGRQEIGFIAQDVMENYPEVVKQKDDGYYGLDYSKITAVLSAQINYLENKITLLENKLKENGLI